MGVPKFFRYMSERYPCLSQYVGEGQIPTFDNLYLDMNGIIHVCSHPDNNALVCINENRIFADIFHYIEYLFRLIRPRRCLFMAVDGVAPRAKCNQQRARRFRTADEAEKAAQEAARKGEPVAASDRFDTNCITPGTQFMARLHLRLKYFITKMISMNDMWRHCTVVLSGHETPGEGEAKIMEYIRYCRAQPGYDPNTRHCLYGLDADLMMLGLCTHEPHFSLLREEVRFDRKSQAKRANVPEEVRFFLLHLSLFREYIELEFAALKQTLVHFAFDIEKIIDDWVLMGFLVGNDFIPNLPHFHIVHGALEDLYNVYIEVLPTLDGYINEAGTLNLVRFEKFLQKLGELDEENFCKYRDEAMYLQSKSHSCNGGKYYPPAKRAKQKADTRTFDMVESPITDKNEDIEENFGEIFEAIMNDTPLPLRLNGSIDAIENGETENIPDNLEDFKEQYYRTKLEYSHVTEDNLKEQAECYVRAIQWNLHYYYNGLCSWSWYYPHHYAPFISDIKGFTAMNLDFEMAEPFKPYEQLLAVLPEASKALLPECYQDLMTEPHSPIVRYYPKDVKVDLNGKRQSWEAVVLLPFIDERQLLAAMATRNPMLSREERERNTHKPMLFYSYTADNLGSFPAPSLSTFEPITVNHAQCKAVTRGALMVPHSKLVKGAYPGAKFDVYYPGFPTMKHLRFTGELLMAKVKVFEQPSRKPSMILNILPSEDSISNDKKLPVHLLGEHVHVKWPYLVEARVVGMANAEKIIQLIEQNGIDGDYNKKENSNTADLFNNDVQYFKEKALNEQGINFGEIFTLIYTRIVLGKRPKFLQNGSVTMEKEYTEVNVTFPLNTIVEKINVYTEESNQKLNITDVFPIGGTCFVLTHPYYGYNATVQKVMHDRVLVAIEMCREPDFSKIIQVEQEILNNYMDSYKCGQILGISGYIFSRITSSLFFYLPKNNNDESESSGPSDCAAGESSSQSFSRKNSINFGLDLKLNRRNIGTPGYTRKMQNLWLYSRATVDVVAAYIDKFPEVFTYLKNNTDTVSANDGVPVTVLFGTDYQQRLNDFKQWHSSLAAHNAERSSCADQQLTKSTLADVQKIVLDSLTQEKRGTVQLQMRPQHLFKPEFHTNSFAVDPSVTTELLDRIVNVSITNGIPIGLKGTVVAICKTASDDAQYKVLFDTEFENNQTACTTNLKEMNIPKSDTLRTYRLSKNVFINLNHGVRTFEAKTGYPGGLVSIAKANTFKSQRNMFDLNGATDKNNATYQRRFYNNTNNNAIAVNSAFAPFLANKMTPANWRLPANNNNLNNTISQSTFSVNMGKSIYPKPLDTVKAKEEIKTWTLSDLFSGYSQEQSKRQDKSSTQSTNNYSDDLSKTTVYLKELLNISPAAGNTKNTNQSPKRINTNNTKQSTDNKVKNNQSNVNCAIVNERKNRYFVNKSNDAAVNILKEDPAIIKSNVLYPEKRKEPQQSSSTTCSNMERKNWFRTKPIQNVQQQQCHSPKKQQNQNQVKRSAPSMIIKDNKMTQNMGTIGANNAPTMCPFVPLQVIKKRSDNSNAKILSAPCSESLPKPDGNLNLSNAPKKTSTASTKTCNHHSSDISKTLNGRQRRTRVAANFTNGPQL